jgi:hypothetical protein
VKSLRKSSSEQGEKLQGLAVMGELDDKMANFLSTRSALTAQATGNIQSFNSISKISYVRNSKLFFRHSSTRKYNGCGSSNLHLHQALNRYHSISSTYSSEDPENHLLDLW